MHRINSKSSPALTIISILLASLMVFSSGCVKKEDKEIKIGVTLPLTGDAAIWGQSQKDGYDLALSQINAKGGINGKEIVLIYEDDKGFPKDGVAALQKLISVDKIKLLTGVANSSVALAYIPIINEQKILFISSGASSPKLTGVSKYFFRTWPSDIAEALAMAKYARNELKLNKIAILYINNDYGIGLSEPFKSTFESLGGKITVTENFEQGATDFRTQLTKIKANNPEAIYLAGNPVEMGRALRQMRELGIKAQVLSISTLNDKEVFKITGAKIIEGTIITDASFDPQSEDPAAKKFMQDFSAMFNHEPGILANTAYDALMILAHAIEKVGTDPDKLSAYLHSMKDYTGVSGKISFSEGGDVNRPIRISVAKNGRFEKRFSDYIWY
jgi:branched-chain amino acid transport system substrate-binding protein